MHNKYDKILRECNRKEESKNVESNINLNIKLLITHLMHRCSGSISNFQSQFMFEWMQHLIRMSQQWMCQGRHGNIFDRSWFQTIDTPSQDVVCYTYNNDHQRQYDVEPHRLTYTRCYTPSITHTTSKKRNQYNNGLELPWNGVILLSNFVPEMKACHVTRPTRLDKKMTEDQPFNSFLAKTASTISTLQALNTS